MTSDAVFNSKGYTDDKWVIDICENLLPANDELEDLRNSRGVRVCRVPKSLSCAKPEAYIPQFVGLGPYHHYRAKLIMTDKLKLAAAKRALKDLFQLDSEKVLDQRLKNSVSDSDIRAFYHIDVSSTYNNQTLSYILTVDALFLLGLLHRGATAKPEEHSHFLTGKRGMALVNADGVELTMDVIIRDVFMLQNQIPTHFLEQITEAVFSKSEDIQSDLGSTMQNFCEALCPIVQFEKLSRNPEAHDHLLDLLYHLIVPDPKPEPEVDSIPDKREPPSECVPKPEPEPKPEPKLDCECVCCFRCCCLCWNILVFLVIVGWIVVSIAQLVLKLVLRALRSLFLTVQWALRPVYVLLVKLSDLIQPAVDALYGCLRDNEADYQFLKPWTKFVGQVKETTDKFRPDSAKGGGRPVVTIPSVTELHSAGIHFQPAKGGISSIEFNDMKCQFHLPEIKLDLNSEAIIRNLVAYETLTKTKGLTFTRYIEIMRAIIDTPQDVKLLVQNSIIHTELSDEVVAQLFNGMSKSIRPTKTPELEQVIGKVNAKFDSAQSLKRAITKYVYSSRKMFTVVAALVFLVLTAVQTYCSVFGCSPASKYTVVLPQDVDSARSNIFMSSV